MSSNNHPVQCSRLGTVGTGAGQEERGIGSSMTQRYTVEGPAEYVMDPIKRSRFVGLILPVSGVDEAQTCVAAARERFPAAGHHCWAFRGADGTSRVNDDGEPSGSAGRPMLAQLEGRSVVDVCVVVARWFGGTKLGVGGLMRAYGGCVGKVLDTAVLVPVVVKVGFELRMSYADVGAVEAIIAQVQGTVVRSEYAELVRMEVSVPEASARRFAAAVSDSTSGRVVPAATGAAK